MSERLHPGLHPDPDALNAFLEGALPEHERVECLAHLAECTRCREVVFLGQKAAQIEEPVVPVKVYEPAAQAQATVSFWRQLLRPVPAMSMVAMAIALLSFGLYRMIRSAERQPPPTASTKAPVGTAARAEEQTPVPRPAPRKTSSPPVTRMSGPPPVSPAPSPAAAAPVPVQAADAAATAPEPQPAPIVRFRQVTETAGVTGTITDPAGAVISSARVEVKNDDTGVVFTSTTGANGNYTIAGLPPGRYDLSVTVPGFKRFVRPGINLQPQEMARLDSPMQVGAAAESVTITAEAPLLKTESGELSHQGDVRSLDQLPLLTGARGSVWPVAGSIPVYTLPDKSTPLSVAAKDNLVVAVDSAGELLVSENAGRNWTRIIAAWKGKAARVSVNANAMFELSTDPASTWVSADGRRWSQVQTSR